MSPSGSPGATVAVESACGPGRGREAREVVMDLTTGLEAVIILAGLAGVAIGASVVGVLWWVLS